MGREMDDDITESLQRTIERESQRIAHSVVALHVRSDPDSIVGDIWRAQTIARSRTRSRDVSDPVTGPGVRVKGPEVGSLTSRLLSAVLLDGGKNRRRFSINPRRSLSANSHSVFDCARGPRSASPHDHFDLRSGTPLRTG